jgi:hypothetical protein
VHPLKETLYLYAFTSHCTLQLVQLLILGLGVGDIVGDGVGPEGVGVGVLEGFGSHGTGPLNAA